MRGSVSTWGLKPRGICYFSMCNTIFTIPVLGELVRDPPLQYYKYNVIHCVLHWLKYHFEATFYNFYFDARALDTQPFK